jgi:hypothetical protein
MEKEITDLKEKMTIEEFRKELCVNDSDTWSRKEAINYIFDNCEIIENEDGSAVVNDENSSEDEFIITDWSTN